MTTVEGRGWRAIALVLALVVAAAGLGWIALRPEGSAPTLGTGEDDSVGSYDRVSARPVIRSNGPHHADVARPAPSQVDAQRPQRIRLPSGASMAVDVTATGADGELAIPPDINRAGWWDGSSRLGDPFGSIVVAAHVDSFTQGLGRFAELLEVGRGDVVRLESPGLWQDYRIVSADLVPKSSLDSDSGLFSPTGDPRLVLITCGGAYDASQGGYQENLIVIAVPEGNLVRRS